MEKFFSLIARVFLASVFFISVLLILNTIFSVPDGYTQYQNTLGVMGLPGIFAPISILVQLIAGLSLLLGYKIRVMAYVLSGYALIWSLTYGLNIYYGPPQLASYHLLSTLRYIAITGGLLHLAINPHSGISLDSLIQKKH